MNCAAYLRLWVYFFVFAGPLIASADDNKNTLSNFANSQYISNAVTILKNISTQLGPWQALIVAFCYVIGISLFFKAIYHLKVYGEARAMMSKDTSLKTPLVWMIVGAAFIYFPTTVDIVMNTTYGTSSQILMYRDWSGSGASTYPKATVMAIFNVVKFLGLISFVRGLIIFTKVAQQGSHQATFGKGFVHVMAGILAMNIVETVNIFSRSISAGG